MDRVIEVGGQCGHAVRIGADLLTRVPERLFAQGFTPAARVLLVVDRNVLEPHAALVRRSMQAAGYDLAEIALDAREEDKSPAALERIWSAALAHRLRRSDVFIALGGGLVGDVAGFAAASYLRGVAIFQCPTSLLAMVDASTGGKTGVNLRLPEGGLGKNLAGAFHAPREVLIAPPVLETLSPRELSSGLAECVKHALLEGEEHLARLESVVEDVRRAPGAGPTAELIERSVRVKAEIVGRDPLEAGERALLNLGHTIAHAIETEPELGLTHGEAVGLGLIAILTVAANEGRASETLVERVTRLLDRCGLPARVRAPVPRERILQRMGYDKKLRGEGLRFVLAEGPGRVRWDQEVSEGALREGLRAIGIE